MTALVPGRTTSGLRACEPAPPVQLTDAAVRLAGRTIWSGVDLTIGVGELVVVLGPNGAGKTTLLRSLLGMVALQRGQASVFGRPPGTAGLEVDYLAQRRPHYAGMRLRARDLIALGVDGHRWGMPLPFGARRAERVERVEAAARTTDAVAYLDRPIGELSGGELQRVLIAQALVRRPRLLLLDEPLTGLDMATQTTIAVLLRRLCRTEGITTVLVAHDVNPFLAGGPKEAPDKVVHVAAGQIAAGRPADVLTGERLTGMYGTPVEVLRTPGGRWVVLGVAG